MVFSSSNLNVFKPKVIAAIALGLAVGQILGLSIFDFGIVTLGQMRFTLGIVLLLVLGIGVLIDARR